MMKWSIWTKIEAKIFAINISMVIFIKKKWEYIIKYCFSIFIHHWSLFQNLKFMDLRNHEWWHVQLCNSVRYKKKCLFWFGDSCSAITRPWCVKDPIPQSSGASFAFEMPTTPTLLSLPETDLESISRTDCSCFLAFPCNCLTITFPKNFTRQSLYTYLLTSSLPWYGSTRFLVLLKAELVVFLT